MMYLAAENETHINNINVSGMKWDKLACWILTVYYVDKEKSCTKPN